MALSGSVSGSNSGKILKRCAISEFDASRNFATSRLISFFDGLELILRPFKTNSWLDTRDGAHSFSTLLACAGDDAIRVAVGCVFLTGLLAQMMERPLDQVCWSHNLWSAHISFAIVSVGHHGWLHWLNQPLDAGGRPMIDIWPDVSSYSESELFTVPQLKFKTGEPASLFSSRHPKTVQRSESLLSSQLGKKIVLNGALHFFLHSL